MHSRLMARPIFKEQVFRNRGFYDIKSLKDFKKRHICVMMNKQRGFL